MASPLPSRKQSVDLAAPVVRVSRIRRDPPPQVKPLTAADIRERDAHNIVIGIIVFALALFVILVAFGKASGWSPSHHPIHIRQSS